MFSTPQSAWIDLEYVCILQSIGSRALEVHSSFDEILLHLNNFPGWIFEISETCSPRCTKYLVGPAIIDSAYFQLPFWATNSQGLTSLKCKINHTNALRKADTKADINSRRSDFPSNLVNFFLTLWGGIMLKKISLESWHTPAYTTEKSMQLSQSLYKLVRI